MLAFIILIIGNIKNKGNKFLKRLCIFFIIIGILELILSLLPGLIMVFKLIACLIDCFTYDWSGIGMIVNNTFYNIF